MPWNLLSGKDHFGRSRISTRRRPVIFEAITEIAAFSGGDGGILVLRMNGNSDAAPRSYQTDAGFPDLPWRMVSISMGLMSLSSSSAQYGAEQKTLSPEEILALHDLLRDVRHGIRNDIAVIVAIAELIRVRPDLLDSKLSQVSTQTSKLVQKLDQFSAEFEKTLGVVRL